MSGTRQKERYRRVLTDPAYLGVSGSASNRRVAGLSGFAAANVGLVTAVVVLMVHAWAAERSAHLHGRQLLVATSIAAVLGLAMILLKDVVLTYVH